MALGYAALIILIFRRPAGSASAFAAVGRAAFTNYLGTSIIAALIFYGYGLGLYPRVAARGLAGRAACLAAHAAWSKPWLDRFQYGPFEWRGAAWRAGSCSRCGRPKRLRPPSLDPAEALVVGLAAEAAVAPALRGSAAGW